MSRIFWDTNVFIYLFEGETDISMQVRDMRQRMLSRKDELLTSWMTVSEIQVQPKREGSDKLCEQYKTAITGTAEVLSFDEHAANAYVQIRASTNVRGADAIQLACASAAGAELFVTNDKKLHGLRVPNIDFITPIDRVPF